LIYCFTKIHTWDFRKIQISINIWSFPISLGIIVFSYTSQIFLPTMEGSMEDRTKFDRMLNWTHVIAAIFKAFFGMLANSLSNRNLHPLVIDSNQLTISL
jgi:vesicular inhibitory amino acid transporter